MATGNIFFSPPGGELRTGEVPADGKYYARFSQAEQYGDEKEPRVALFFEAIEAYWFDRNELGAEQPARPLLLGYFNVARLALLEIRISEDQLGLYGDGLPGPNGEEVPWVEIYSERPGNGQVMLVYANLFQAGAERSMAKIAPVSPNKARSLSKTVSIQDLPDASSEELAAVLDPIGRSETPSVIAYDVGQGNAIGFLDGIGGVKAYSDFGGGAGAHAGTFPAALKSFCFSNNPPILLSHWDHDHWSSAYRDPRAFHQIWIAPRQTIGAIQAAVITQIVMVGRLLLVSPSFTRFETGSIAVEKCTGSNRNNGGLAITLSEKVDGQGEKMLFPGDAVYRYIPSTLSGVSYHSVVVPHHGAKAAAANVPPCSGNVASRLVYSYGKPNQYYHATDEARRAHHSVGWTDPLVAPAGPVGCVRNTPLRTSGLPGHILMTWRPSVIPPVPPCGGAMCQLRAQQF